MSSIIQLLDRYPEDIAQTIDLTLELLSSGGVTYRRGMPDPALVPMMPINRYPMAKLALQKIAERRPTVAFIVGVDGEVPIRREPMELSIENVGSAKLARSRLFTESDFDLLREAEMSLAANNPQAYQAFVDTYMQTPAQLTMAVDILARVLLIQVFSAGACTYIDAETTLGYEISYLAQVPAVNRPAALGANNVWNRTWTGGSAVPTTQAELDTSLASVQPLENLKAHLNNYYSGNPIGTGVFTMPEAIVMASRVADAMLNAPDTRLKIARMRGVNIDFAAPTLASVLNIPRPTIEECRTWLAGEITAAAQGAMSVPDFVVSDAVYYTVTAAGTVSNPIPFFPTDMYWFGTNNIVEGAFVPTATNNYANEMAFITEDVSRSPRREKATIDTRFLALCTDPRMLGWRTVLA